MQGPKHILSHFKGRHELLSSTTPRFEHPTQLQDVTADYNANQQCKIALAAQARWGASAKVCHSLPTSRKVMPAGKRKVQ